MGEVDFDLTSIELGLVVLVLPVRTFEDYRPVWDKAGRTRVWLSRTEVREILLNIDSALEEKIPKMADRVKAELFIKNKSVLLAKLRRALIMPV